MFHALRTGYWWSLVKLPGACVRLKLHRICVALAPHPECGGGGNKKEQVRSWKVSDWKIVGAYHLAWCLHWSVRRCCTLLGWLQISVTILLRVWKLPFFNCKREYKHMLSTDSKIGGKPEGVLPVADSSSKYFACLEFSQISRGFLCEPLKSSL